MGLYMSTPGNKVTSNMSLRGGSYTNKDLCGVLNLVVGFQNPIAWSSFGDEDRWLQDYVTKQCTTVGMDLWYETISGKNPGSMVYRCFWDERVTSDWL